PAEGLRGVPAGRQFEHPEKRWNRSWPDHRQKNYRHARRTHMGGVESGEGLDLPLHAAGARRAAEASDMSKRILVVEDEEDKRRIVRDLLTTVGYEIIEAVTGEEGVKAAETQLPDLILMDIQLPGLDGYEATRRIKANPVLHHIPIIVVTSYALS